MIAALLAAFVLTPQDAAPPAESLLRAAPEGTVVTLVCEDVPGLVAGLRAGPLGVLWEDEALAPLRAKLDEAVAEVWEQEAYPGGPLGGELFGGLEAAVFFLGGFEGGEPSAGALVLAVRDELSHELAAMLAAEGGESERVAFDGLEFQVDLGDDGEWMVSGEWLRGLVFAYGNERERSLYRARDLVEALEAEPEHATQTGRTLLARRGPASAVQILIDAERLVPGLVGDDDDLALVRELGIDRLGWVSMALAARADGGVELRGEADIPRDGVIADWLNLARPAPLDLGRIAPRDVVDASFLGFDVDGVRMVLATLVGLFESTQRIGEADPGGDSDAETETDESHEHFERRLDELTALLGIDLRESLFANLTGDFARFVLPDALAYADAPDEPLAAIDLALSWGWAGLPQVGAVHAVGLRDREAMEELIDALIGLSGADAYLHEEQIGDHWVQHFEAPDLPLQGVRPCWVVLDDLLLYSGGLESLEAALGQIVDTERPSWLDDEQRLARARALVEAGASSLAMADLSAWTRRRFLRPLAEADAALAQDAYGGWLRQLIAGFSSSSTPEEEASMVEEARRWLRLVGSAGDRLCDGPLRGTWTSTVGWTGERLVYRSVIEPEKRD